MDFTFATIGSIAVLTFVICQIIKQIPALNNKAIPVIALAVGCILGGVGFATGIPGLAELNLFDALATGAISGISSSGMFSLYKNLTGAYE